MIRDDEYVTHVSSGPDDRTGARYSEPVPLPPHLYGALGATKEGRDILLRSRALKLPLRILAAAAAAAPPLPPQLTPPTGLPADASPRSRNNTSLLYSKLGSAR